LLSGLVYRVVLLRTLLVDQRGEHFVLFAGQVGQRRPHRACVIAGDLGACLDDAHGVTGLAVADVQVRQEEVVDDLADSGVIFTGNRVVEIHRGFGMKLNTADE